MPHLEQEGSRGSIDLIRAQGLKLSPPPPSTCYPLAVKREVSCCRGLMTSWLYINTLAKRQQREKAFLTIAPNSKTGAARGGKRASSDATLVGITSCQFQASLNCFYSMCRTRKHLKVRLYKISASFDGETQHLYHRLILYFVEEGIIRATKLSYGQRQYENKRNCSPTIATAVLIVPCTY